MTWDGTPVTPSVAITADNCMVTLVEAMAYFGGRLWSEAWDAATEANQAKALITATGHLNNLQYLGAKVASDQANAFPRAYAYAPEPMANVRGVQVSTYTDSGIPENVKKAVCEHAIFLLSLTAYERDRTRHQAQGIIGGGMGKANEYSNADFVAAARAGSVIAPEALRLLGNYLARSVPLT